MSKPLMWLFVASEKDKRFWFEKIFSEWPNNAKVVRLSIVSEDDQPLPELRTEGNSYFG